MLAPTEHAGSEVAGSWDSATFDVVVVGGGLAAIAAAWRLAHGGVERVAIVAPRGAPGWPALLAPGHHDHPARLAGSLGDDAAAAIWRFGARGVEVGADLANALDVPYRRGPALALATAPAEQTELDASMPLAARLGLGLRPFEGPCDGHGGRPSGLGAGVIDDTLVVDLAALVSAGRSALEAKGVRCSSERAIALEVTAHGVHVILADSSTASASPRPLHAEIALIAAGAARAPLHPLLDGALVPVRAQGFRAPLPAPSPTSLLADPVTATWGHEVYLAHDGAFVAHGLRPDTPPEDLASDAGPTDAFQAFLERFARQRVPSLPAPLARHAHAGLVALSADGLPVVGALPGSERVLCATGFGFREGASALAAGDAVARLVLGEEAAIPAGLLARRLA